MIKTLGITTAVLLAGLVQTGVLMQKPLIVVPQDYSAVIETQTALPWTPQKAPAASLAGEEGDADSEIVALDLPRLELLATLIGSAKERMACIRDLESGQQRMYRRGEKVCAFNVNEITAGEVLLMNDAGIRITLVTTGRSGASAQSAQDSWIIPLEGNRSVVKRSILFKKTSEIIRSAGNVSVHPYAHGSIKGLQIVTLPPGSVFAQSGLLPNDVIQAVNNQAVDSYQKALQVAKKLPSQQQIEVKLIRNGKPLMLTFVMD